MRRAGAATALTVVLCLSITTHAKSADTGHEMRIWTDLNSGQQAEAALLEIKGTRAVLRRPSGKLAAVDIERLSDADQQYLSEVTSSQKKPSFPVKDEPGAKGTFDRLLAGISKSMSGASNWLAGDWRKSLASSTVPETKTAAVQNELTPARLATIKVSRELLAQRVGRDVARQQPIRDVIVSVPVAGSAFTQGRTAVQLVPSPNHAVVDILLSGVSHSDTTGSTQGVTIQTQGVTHFTARKRLMLTARGLEALPTVASAQTETQTTGLGTSRPRLRGRIALRIASSRVAESRGQANWESARSAERRISQALDQETESLLAALQPQIAATTNELASIQRETGYQLRYSTTPLHLVITVDDPQGDKNVMPPVLADDRPVAAQVHSSLLKQVLGNERIRRLVGRWTRSSSEKGMLVSTRANSMQMKSRWSRDRNWLTLNWDDGNDDDPEDKLARQ